jgi:hypothetical protein
MPAMIFIQNKYTRIYYSIISNAQTRTLPSSVYVEEHHIIPKSLGGDNSRSNLVSLTGREHFICHRLLTKITAGLDKQKMSHAVWSMLVRGKNTDKGLVTSRTFELARIEAAKASSVSLTGIKRSDETKKRMTKPKSAHHTALLISRCLAMAENRRGAPAHNKGKTGTNSPLFNLPKSEYTKQQMRKPKEKATCPHCGLTGGINQLKRWHFNNCKTKEL